MEVSSQHRRGHGTPSPAVIAAAAVPTIRAAQIAETRTPTDFDDRRAGDPRPGEALTRFASHGMTGDSEQTAIAEQANANREIAATRFSGSVECQRQSSWRFSEQTRHSISPEVESPSTGSSVPVLAVRF